MDQDIRVPNKLHPITVEPYSGTVVVKSGEAELARSDRALALAECDFPVIYYIPRDDVHMQSFARTDFETYCPYKGTATHYTARVGDAELKNIAWIYEDAYPAVDTIAGHVAFYPNRIAVEAEEAEAM